MKTKWGLWVALHPTQYAVTKCGVATQGFNPAEVADAYGDTLTFWDWRERKVVQTIKLGADGLIPLVRLWPWSANHVPNCCYVVVTSGW